MRALCLTRPGQFDEIDARDPGAPGPGEVLCRVDRIGVCGTDLHAYQGRQTFFTYPRVLGHELGVEVIETGAGVDTLKPGDRCAVEPYLNCGKCVACRRGRVNCCQNMKVLGVHIDGGMAPRLIMPAHKLHRSTKLSFDQLAVVEPLCIGAHAVARVNMQPDDTLLIIGAGPIGLAVVESARAAGMNPLMMEMSRSRLAHVRDRVGLRTIDAAGDAAAQIREALEGELPRYVFDCTGNPRSMAATFDLVGQAGEIVFVGHYPGEITFPDATFHWKETTLHASRNASPEDFHKVMALLEAGRIDIGHWLAPAVEPAAVADRFPSWLDPENGVIKPVIAWA